MQRIFSPLASLLFSTALLTSGSASARAAAPPVRPPAVPQPTDTIVIRLPNQAVLTLMVRDAAQLRELKKYQLDSLTSRLAGYIGQAEAAARTGTNERVTMEFYPDKDRPGQNLPEQIRVTSHKPVPGKSVASNRVEVLLEKKFGVLVNIDKNNGTQPRTAADRADSQAKRDSIRQTAHENQNGKSFLVVDVGVSGFVNQKAYFTAAGQPETVDLRTLGSRYFNIGLDYRIRLGGKHSPLRLNIGPEFAFNNYMLNGNDKWVNANGRTDVVREPDASRQYQKSKLATSSVNLPLMLNLRLHDSHYKPTFSVGAGGFVGYRLLTWGKLKYTTDGDTKKDKDYNAYNMENLQYGLQATLGFRNLTLFAKYNLNPLFKAGQGPDTQVLSFGVRLLGQ